MIIPEITSLMNAYAFIKGAVYRVIRRKFRDNKEILDLVDRAASTVGTVRIPNISSLINAVDEVDPDGTSEIKSVCANFFPKIVVNLSTGGKDLEFANKLKSISRSFLNLNCEIYGMIPQDDHVSKSISVLQPLMLVYPNSPAAVGIKKISLKLIAAEFLPRISEEVRLYSDAQGTSSQDFM